MQPASNTTLALKSGAFPGSNEAVAFSGIDDWVYVAPAEQLTKRSNAFTIAVRFAPWFPHEAVTQLFRFLLGMGCF
jgi:hypothetical protein